MKVFEKALEAFPTVVTGPGLRIQESLQEALHLITHISKSQSFFTGVCFICGFFVSLLHEASCLPGNTGKSGFPRQVGRSPGAPFKETVVDQPSARNSHKLPHHAWPNWAHRKNIEYGQNLLLTGVRAPVSMVWHDPTFRFVSLGLIPPSCQKFVVTS